MVLASKSSKGTRITMKNNGFATKIIKRNKNNNEKQWFWHQTRHFFRVIHVPGYDLDAKNNCFSLLFLFLLMMLMPKPLFFIAILVRVHHLVR